MLNREKISYILYFICVLVIFADFTNSFPLFSKNIFNKVLYIDIFCFFILNLNRFSKIKKELFLPLIFIFSYMILLITNSLFLSEKQLAGIVIAISYFLLFLIFLTHIQSWSIVKYIKPFYYATTFIILTSLLVYLGIDIPLYFDNQDLLNVYKIKRDYSLENSTAFSGIFVNQNSFATILFISLVIQIFKIKEYYTSNFTLKRIFVICLFSITIFFLIKTMSRTSIVAFLLFLLIIILKDSFRLKGIINILILFFTCLIIFLLFNEYIIKIIDRTINEGSSYRDIIWNDAFIKFLENPISGVGNYSYISGDFIFTAHNYFLQILASHGIFIFIFISLFFIFFIYKSLKIYFKSLIDDKVKNEKLYFVAAFIAIIFHQLFETGMHIPLVPITVFMFLVLTIILKKIKY